MREGEQPEPGFGMVSETELEEFATWRSELTEQYRKEGEEMHAAILITNERGEKFVYFDAFTHLRRIVCEGPSAVRAGERFQQLSWQYSGTFTMTPSGVKSIQLTAPHEEISELIVDKDGFLAALDQACVRANDLLSRIATASSV